jgi:hypothetical protein
VMGGVCWECGYAKHPSALSLHHLDPKKKDPLSRNIRYWTWTRVLREIRKCALLCANCHCAVHVDKLVLTLKFKPIETKP